MATTKPTIPVILTDANWQKQKGILAKAHGETGIGELMKKLAAAFNNVDWPLFDTSSISPADLTPEKIRKLGEQAFKEYRVGIAGKTRDAALALSRQAHSVTTEWEKSSTIPASSRKHVKTIETEALNFATAMRDFTDWQKDYEDILDQIERKQQGRFKQLHTVLSTALKNRLAQQDAYREVIKTGEALANSLKKTQFTQATLPQISKQAAAYSDALEKTTRKYDSLGTRQDLGEKDEIRTLNDPDLNKMLAQYMTYLSVTIPLINTAAALEAKIQSLVEVGQVNLKKDTMSVEQLRDILKKSMKELEKTRGPIEGIASGSKNVLTNDMTKPANWNVDMVRAQNGILKLHVQAVDKVTDKWTALVSLHKTILAKARQLKQVQQMDIFPACETLIAETGKMIKTCRALCAKADTQLKTALKNATAKK